MITQNNINNITVILAAVGYTYDAGTDGAYLSLLWNEVEMEIYHACNVSEISDCDYPEIERVVAYRLMSLKLKTGTLTGVSVNSVVKRVSEGDTTVEYAVSNSSGSDSLVAYFDKQSELSKELVTNHRKLVW